MVNLEQADEVLNNMRFSFAMKLVGEYTEKGEADQE